MTQQRVTAAEYQSLLAGKPVPDTKPQRSTGTSSWGPYRGLPCRVCGGKVTLKDAFEARTVMSQDGGRVVERWIRHLSCR